MKDWAMAVGSEGAVAQVVVTGRGEDQVNDLDKAVGVGLRGEGACKVLSVELLEGGQYEGDP